MRLAFFGTPEFAVPSLKRLLEGTHEVALVVSQPDRGRGRGRKTSPSPVAELALEREIKLLRPESIATPEFKESLEEAAIDLGVVVAFGQFIPKRIREAPSRGFLINGHASILPRYRGAAPIQHAILNGDEETGVSVMRIEREMDAGDTLLIHRTPIEPGEDAGSLTKRLSLLCADALEEAVSGIEAGAMQWTPQDPAGVTYAAKIRKEDSQLDWEQPARSLVRRVRAMAPKPGAATLWEGNPLRILAAEVDPSPCALTPGTVDRPAKGPLRIATGEGWLVPAVLQRAGGKPLQREVFLRGVDIVAGTRLEAPEVRPNP